MSKLPEQREPERRELVRDARLRVLRVEELTELRAVNKAWERAMKEQPK